LLSGCFAPAVDDDESVTVELPGYTVAQAPTPRREPVPSRRPGRRRIPVVAQAQDERVDSSVVRSPEAQFSACTPVRVAPESTCSLSQGHTNGPVTFQVRESCGSPGLALECEVTVKGQRLDVALVGTQCPTVTTSSDECLARTYTCTVPALPANIYSIYFGDQPAVPVGNPRVPLWTVDGGSQTSCELPVERRFGPLDLDVSALDTACATDDDCAAVATSNVCTQCPGLGAVSRGALGQHNALLADAQRTCELSPQQPALCAHAKAQCGAHKRCELAAP
jgi:hypothetical protein